MYSSFISIVQQVSIAGTELLPGKLFDQIGFGQIDDELFRNLELSRLCYLVSKLKTTDYLQKSHGIAIDIAKAIYAIKVVTLLNKDEIHQTLILNKEQEFLA